KSVKVRQAKFAGRISASEQEGLLAWVVQFTLKEFDSVPEKREARLPGKPANIGTGSPGTAAAGAGGSSQPGEETLSSGEAFFKQLDNKLGDVLA
ncbi:baseplate complex protein, partial [Aeromonas rivuli]